MKPITICALSFGDQLTTTQRCLRSIATALPEDTRVVEEFRLILNCCDEPLRDWIMAWAYEIAGGWHIPVTLYITDQNRFKYPLMRKVFRQPEPIATPFVMWFDDDSYFEPLRPGWWMDMLSAASAADMIGQIWTMPVQGNQLEWIKTQPWFNPEVPMPPPKKARGEPAFEFIQGAWWVAKTEMFLNYDWPVAEIRHNGGDSMLGEMMRHRGLKMRRFISGSNDKHDGVRINADARGRHSKSKRRGHSENRVGWNYDGKPLDTSHQDFEIECRRVLPPPPPTPEIINLFDL